MSMLDKRIDESWWPVFRMNRDELLELVKGLNDYSGIAAQWLHWSAAQRRLWRQGDTRRRMFA